jgi:hypothetical protein
MIRIQRCTAVAISAIAVASGCKGAGEFARDMGMAAGEGAVGGFSDYVSYQQQDQWGQAWRPSGRGVSGVSGVAMRGVREVDCAAVPDESLLYVGDLLRSPGSVVSTIDGEIDQKAFASLSKSGLRLAGAHKGGAIGILQTTAGRHARFVLQWDERPHLHDLTVYDAGTGEATLRFQIPMPLAPHALVNLDSGESEGFDLLFGPGPDGRPTLAAGEGAALSFPVQSLCAKRVS